MARSLLHMKVVAASALSRSLITYPFFRCRREYTVVAGKVGLSTGSIRADPKQGDDKAAAGYRQRSWMPDPVTGYYIPEDHFGETDIAELRENMLKEHSTISRGGPN
uniref:Late embryogenesis abundant protein LEA3-3 n=1 Tax=Pinus tabuliformis TaxID=88731 RepID=A0A0A7REC6_PINTB|nr:late embryogenesis abundant protein LEA3-3 [Pinus tabuliformis]